MNPDVEFHIRNKYSWSRLPANVKQQLGNSQIEYEKCIKSFSIKNQLRHKTNLVRTVAKDDKRYYEALLRYSRDHLMLFPYHLSDVIVKGMRVTPFQYYLTMMQDLMTQEKSYDSLPNFTAADCLRLLGIGRNQYIDLMNQNRSSKKFFSRRKPVKYVLPTHPVTDLVIDPWWKVHVGYITEDDIKIVNEGEKTLIDLVIDNGAQRTGNCSFKAVHSLYRKGLIYLDVPINDEDCIIVPPLEGFVMNRVLGDYLETLLYKIFVSIDEHTSVAELANILQIDLELVKNAVSLYCRLGIAYRKGQDFDPATCHPSWSQYKKPSPKRQCDADGSLLIDWGSVEKISGEAEVSFSQKSPDSSCAEDAVSESNELSTGSSFSKRIAFLFDSSLTAFLMMGNLSPGLKSHAVTMFEVGKLPDESLDSLLAELDKISETGEGEAQRYYDHALTLQSTVRFLKNNPELRVSDTPSSGIGGMGLDLIRCESLLSLEPATCARLLNKNYALLVSMAPLSNEIRPITSCLPPHLGPSIPEVSSIWFKLFVYHLTGYGPPTLLLAKGTRLRKLPKVFQNYDRLMVTTWGHDPGVAPTSNALLTLNDALSHSAVLVQAYGCKRDGETIFVPFPFDAKETSSKSGIHSHPAIQKLAASLDLKHTCGYITMINITKPNVNNDSKHSNKFTESKEETSSNTSVIDGLTGAEAAELLAAELDELKMTASDVTIKNEEPSLNLENWTLLDCYFGLPLFDLQLNKNICQRISQNGLCRAESLNKSTHSSRLLTIQLLEFLFNVQGSTPETESRFDLTASKKSSDMLNIPAPCKNLLFIDGKFQQWNESVFRKSSANG